MPRGWRWDVWNCSDGGGQLRRFRHLAFSATASLPSSARFLVCGRVSYPFERHSQWWNGAVYGADTYTNAALFAAATGRMGRRAGICCCDASSHSLASASMNAGRAKRPPPPLYAPTSSCRAEHACHLPTGDCHRHVTATPACPSPASMAYFFCCPHPAALPVPCVLLAGSDRGGREEGPLAAYKT